MLNIRQDIARDSQCVLRMRQFSPVMPLMRVVNWRWLGGQSQLSRPSTHSILSPARRRT